MKRLLDQGPYLKKCSETSGSLETLPDDLLVQGADLAYKKGDHASFFHLCLTSLDFRSVGKVVGETAQTRLIGARLSPQLALDMILQIGDPILRMSELSALEHYHKEAGLFNRIEIQLQETANDLRGKQLSEGLCRTAAQLGPKSRPLLDQFANRLNPDLEAEVQAALAQGYHVYDQLHDPFFWTIPALKDQKVRTALPDWILESQCDINALEKRIHEHFQEHDAVYWACICSIVGNISWRNLPGRFEKGEELLRQDVPWTPRLFELCSEFLRSWPDALSFASALEPNLKGPLLIILWQTQANRLPDTGSICAAVDRMEDLGSRIHWKLRFIGEPKLPAIQRKRWLQSLKKEMAYCRFHCSSEDLARYLGLLWETDEKQAKDELLLITSLQTLSLDKFLNMIRLYQGPPEGLPGFVLDEANLFAARLVDLDWKKYHIRLDIVAACIPTLASTSNWKTYLGDALRMLNEQERDVVRYEAVMALKEKRLDEAETIISDIGATDLRTKAWLKVMSDRGEPFGFSELLQITQDSNAAYWEMRLLNILNNPPTNTLVGLIEDDGEWDRLLWVRAVIDLASSLTEGPEPRAWDHELQERLLTINPLKLAPQEDAHLLWVLPQIAFLRSLAAPPCADHEFKEAIHGVLAFREFSFETRFQAVCLAISLFFRYWDHALKRGAKPPSVSGLRKLLFKFPRTPDWDAPADGCPEYEKRLAYLLESEGQDCNNPLSGNRFKDSPGLWLRIFLRKLAVLDYDPFHPSQWFVIRDFREVMRVLNRKSACWMKFFSRKCLKILEGYGGEAQSAIIPRVWLNGYMAINGQAPKELKIKIRKKEIGLESSSAQTQQLTEKWSATETDLLSPAWPGPDTMKNLGLGSFVTLFIFLEPAYAFLNQTESRFSTIYVPFWSVPTCIILWGLISGSLSIFLLNMREPKGYKLKSSWKWFASLLGVFPFAWLYIFYFLQKKANEKSSVFFVETGQKKRRTLSQSQYLILRWWPGNRFYFISFLIPLPLFHQLMAHLFSQINPKEHYWVGLLFVLLIQTSLIGVFLAMIKNRWQMMLRYPVLKWMVIIGVVFCAIPNFWGPLIGAVFASSAGMAGWGYCMQLMEKRHHASRLPAWSLNQERLEREKEKAPFWQMKKRFHSIDRFIPGFARTGSLRDSMFRIKLTALFFEGFWLTTFLRESPLWTTTFWCSFCMLLLGLLLFLVVPEKLLSNRVQDADFQRSPSRTLLFGQGLFLTGCVSGIYFWEGPFLISPKLFMILGICVAGAIIIYLGSSIRANWQSAMNIIMTLLLLSFHLLCMKSIMYGTEFPNKTLLLSLCTMWIVGVVGGPVLLLPFRLSDIKNMPRLPGLKCAALYMLTILPFGGLWMPLWIRLRRSGWDDYKNQYYQQKWKALSD